MVMRQSHSVHARLVQMLIDDDKGTAPKTDSGFSLTDGFTDQ